VYIVESLAGWSETHNRKAADEAVTKFLAPLDVDEVLRAFQTSIELSGHAEHWEDVLKFLGEVTNQPSKLVPDIVAVAFWGQLAVFENQQGTN
jgi:hypothetical protein